MQGSERVVAVRLAHFGRHDDVVHHHQTLVASDSFMDDEVSVDGEAMAAWWSVLAVA